MSIVALNALQDNYIWLIINEQRHHVCCIDPGDSAPVIHYLAHHKLHLTHILLTHHHPDHCGGVQRLIELFPDTLVYGPADDRITPSPITVHDEAMIPVDDYVFRVLSTPGHTQSHICYQEPTQGWLFCGDTLFSGGCGRVFDGTLAQLYDSLQLLSCLPPDTRIFCAHEYTRNNLHFAKTIDPDNQTLQSYSSYLDAHPEQCSLPSTMALEKQINPFLRLQTAALQAFAIQQQIDPNNHPLIFNKLRELKNHFQ